MKVIRCLSEKIQEELHDAEEYIDLAMSWKEEDEGTAEVFAGLSEEEMKHVGILHDRVSSLIKEYREENGEPPKGMMALYDYLHTQQIENTMRVKVKQAMYDT